MTHAPLGELAIRAGVVGRDQVEAALRRQQARRRLGDFRRLGEVLVESKFCDPAAVRGLLRRQGIAVVRCTLCGTRYNGLSFRGQKACLRCGRALTATALGDPLAVEDAVTDPGPAGDALLRASLARTLDVDGYRVLGEVGRGAMGVVYKAWEPGAQRYVALKFVLNASNLPYEEALRFKREAQALIALSHPHIVPGHALREVAGLTYMVMGFIPGVGLDVLLAQGVLGPEQIVRVLAQVAGALDHAHRRGLIHRDVKPGNIVVDTEGRGYLVDFGIAKSADESMSLTAEGEVVGSLAYMAPEYASQGVEALEPAADIYGLGVVLYAALSGALPYGDPRDDEMVVRLVQEPPTPLRQVCPGASPALAQVVDRAIAKLPEDRYRTAEELRLALERTLSG